jgi:thiol-disulfide isomerase/thioredoxin
MSENIKKYLKYKTKYIKLKNKLNNIEMFGGSNSNKTIYLFKAEWCGYCNMFKSVWTQLQNDYKNKAVFITYDADKNRNELSKYDIEGFPTIILQIGNKTIEYRGNRDLNSLKNFIDETN